MVTGAVQPDPGGRAVCWSEGAAVLLFQRPPCLGNTGMKLSTFLTVSAILQLFLIYKLLLFRNCIYVVNYNSHGKWLAEVLFAIKINVITHFLHQ